MRRLLPAALSALLLVGAACSADEPEVDAGAGPEPSAATEPDEAPSDPTAAPAEPTETLPGAVPSTLLVLEPGASTLAPSIPGPGVARTRAEGQGLLGRHGLDPDDEEVLRHLDDGTEVVVAGLVGGGCEAPTGAAVVPAATTGLDIVETGADDDPGCDADVTAIVVLALAATDVPVGTVVEGSSDDLPTGVGEVLAVEPVGAEAEVLAEPYDDAAVAAVPGAADLDLPEPREGAERLVFVVPACAATAAELVADVAAGTVTAVAHQDGAPGVACDALTPHLVVADLASDLVGTLEPVAA